MRGKKAKPPNSYRVRAVSYERRKALPPAGATTSIAVIPPRDARGADALRQARACSSGPFGAVGIRLPCQCLAGARGVPVGAVGRHGRFSDNSRSFGRSAGLLCLCCRGEKVLQ